MDVVDVEIDTLISTLLNFNSVGDVVKDCLA